VRREVVGHGASRSDRIPVPAVRRTYPRAVASRTRAATYARRRKRRMALVEHDLTEEQWLALMEAWAGCAYCGGDGAALQKDTMLPISRGGRYTLTNVVPACLPCNASKCNTEVTTWLRRKKRDDGAFLVRQLEIARSLSP
jgi:5-methylcytosine-specific restriction endonuclease McrA